MRTNLKIKKIRKKMNLTQKQLGQIMGMRQQSFSRLETGEREMTLQQRNYFLVLQTLDREGWLKKITSKLEEGEK